MLEFLEIIGGQELSGCVTVSGAKNAALPMLIAPLLTAESCTLSNVPALRDVDLLLSLLSQLGANITRHENQVSINTPTLGTGEVSFSLVKSLRASFWILGPLLARTRSARVALPGGDIIGSRPVDIHLEALTQMGAEIRTVNGIVYAEAPAGLHGANINFRFPSVGATHQILLAAVLSKGVTRITGAAREPEVVALADLLNAMGAEIEGAGTDEIVIVGKTSLGGANIDIIGDRIEAATFLCAGIACRGAVTVAGINPAHLGPLPEMLHMMGADLSLKGNCIELVAGDQLMPVNVRTGPFPEFATDMQPPMMAAMCLAEGISAVEETIFEARMGHAFELKKFGAQIAIDGKFARISGVREFSPAFAECLDIRCGAALVIAALAAKGTSRLYEIQHLRRGYVNIEQKFRDLGAQLGVRAESPEDYMMSGC